MLSHHYSREQRIHQKPFINMCFDKLHRHLCKSLGLRCFGSFLLVTFPHTVAYRCFVMHRANSRIWLPVPHSYLSIVFFNRCPHSNICAQCTPRAAVLSAPPALPPCNHFQPSRFTSFYLSLPQQLMIFPIIIIFSNDSLFNK